ncbi:MAG: acylphosphatase [Parachlamydiaceae bacterium]|nr:acylphosphatase [Parachlamydiaceae bacterium]
MSFPRLELHAIVYGRVQGVGFRAQAQVYAKKLKIQGIIRNCPNGAVEIYAQGEQSSLKAFLDLLKSTFSIDRIEVSYRPSTNSYVDFKIVY